jgi:hypothetical protein
MKKKYKPGLAGDVDGVYFFSKCQPPVVAGDKFVVQVSQAAGDQLKTDGSQAVHFVVEGTHERLAETDIVGRYPAPGTSSSDECLPHIALSRQSLPWERLRIKGDGSSPWMALLVFKRSEIITPVTSTKVKGSGLFYSKLKSLGYADDTQLDLVWVGENYLREILPLVSELPLLCHVQRLGKGGGPAPAESADADPMWTLDDDATVAIVMSNRFPDATGAGEPEEHVACLVSLEGRDDLPWPEPGKRTAYNLPAQGAAPAAASSTAPGKTVPLVVLHSWRFTPSKLGDFAQVIKAIRYAPNGGVLRFGQLPATKSQPQGGALTDADGYLVLDTPAEPTKKAYYRGPLVPKEVPRDAEPAVSVAPSVLQASANSEKLDDYSYAAAFELGRLLTLANDGLLSDLQAVRRPQIQLVVKDLLVANPPQGLAQKDWVQVSQKLPLSQQIRAKAKADFTGVAAFKAEINVAEVVSDLAAHQSGLELEQTIDIDAIGIDELEAQFSPLVTHSQSAGKGFK